MIRITIILLLFISQIPFAHNLDVVTRNENGELVIQVWMGDDPGESIEISIYSENGEIRFNGQTNAEGIMRWQPMIEEPLTITVYAEPGHESEIKLPAEQVKEIVSGTVSFTQSQSSQNESSSSHELTSTRQNRQPLVNILAGLGFILSLAAVWMAYRNQQRIANLEKKWQNRER